MARPFHDKFDKDSPLSPMSAGSTSTPISYSVNLNRSKTKKWVETKPADYGGDDWGDNYGDYEPAAPARPTGLRQPGQVAQSPIVAGPSKMEANKRAYGELPSLPEETQSRSMINPVGGRTNSFTKNDEYRTFSGSYTQPSAPSTSIAVNTRSDEIPSRQPVATPSNIQPVLHVSTQVPTVTGSMKVAQPSIPVDAQKSQVPVQADEPESGASSKYSEVRSPVSDFQSRRDFSPSAVPSPLQPHHSPAPQGSGPNSASSRFPPRKSSISRPTPPETFETSQSPQLATAAKPWVDARPVSPSSPNMRGRSPSTGGSTVPLIRPSDIYKRIDMEREKERQSIESNRPSMESIIDSRTAEGPSLPTQAAPPTQSTEPIHATPRRKSSSDSLKASLKKSAGQYIEPEYDYGRHLAPTLEPVSERKSEYGFEGFDPAMVVEAPQEEQENPNDKDFDESQRGHEELRRFSVSPKLPDLTRISTFGLDLFSQPNVGGTSHQGDTIPPVPENRAATNETTDLKLRTQPSFGFTSVVQQAFDAESSSVPETPASSRAARSGSDSTGTTGISPIMSRVPGSITRHRDLEAQDTTISAITEVDEPQAEPHQPEQKSGYSKNMETDQSGNQPLRQEYRRNMSTPSPGNSPATTPLLETGEKHITAEESHVSPTSDVTVSPVDDEGDLPAPSRPSVEREKSFRPHLPGSWVSYGTNASDPATDRDSSIHQPSETPYPQTEASHTPVSPISEASDNEVDLTPTTAKRPLHHSALGAGAGAALGGVTAMTFARRERDSPRSSSPGVTSAPAAQAGTDNDTLPTPDPALAPVTNPYIAHTLDPRLVTTTKDSEAALQVPSTSQPVSSASSVPPAPPPKDTPDAGSTLHNLDYFPAPTVPLKPKTKDELYGNEHLASPVRPQMLPTLSTHTSPQDKDSDKLRKEIIKSLSPTTSNAAEIQRSLPPHPQEPAHIEQPAVQGTRESIYETRESTYLPSEYDNYWESTNEASAEPEKAEGAGLEAPQGPDSPHSTFQRPSELDTDPKPISTVPPLPLSSSDVGYSTSLQPPAERPPLHPHRFSWEAGPEHVSAKTVTAHPELQEPAPATEARSATTPDAQIRQLGQNGEAAKEQEPFITPVDSPGARTIQADPTHGSSSVQGTNDQHKPSNQAPSGAELAGGMGIIAGVAGVSGLLSQKTNNDQPQRRLSLAEEKIAITASSYPVSPEPPEDEHPARSSLPIASPVHLSSNPLASATLSPNQDSTVTPPKQRISDITKIRQFRDILSFQDPEQRIRAYNDTRDQFAHMDTGLNDWIMSLYTQHQPDSIEPWSTSANPGINDGRPKLPTHTAPLQQPYYQQYLNASPSTPASQIQRPGPGTMPSSQQGLTSSGGKQHGQQNQSKGKDLLHSAGIFGGKATKAGKGLFSMGRNKFRGSGGGDKNSPPLETSPAPKVKAVDGRRSSWGISMTSLTLPRLGRTDAASQHSRESTPTRQPPSQLGQDAGPAQARAAVTTVGQSERSIMDEPVSAVSTPSIPHATLHPLARDEPDSFRESGNMDDHSTELEERDGLGVPAPIGKQQPSWDPYNATPIAEEEGFQYDDRSSRQLSTAPALFNQLAAPVAPAVETTSDRSTSGETPKFYDAREAPNDNEDWILVSKDEDAPRDSEGRHQTEQPIQESVATLLPLSKFQVPLPIDPPKQFGPPGSEDLPREYRSQMKYQPEGSRQQPTTFQTQPSFAPQAAYQPPGGTTPVAISQSSSDAPPHTSSHGGFRDRFMQHIRQRSSKDNALPIEQQSTQQHIRQKSSKDNTLPGNQVAASQNQAKDRPPQGAAEDVQSPISTVQHSPDFVGLPPIRRSSTFGLGFRQKAARERFPIDDSDEDEPKVGTGVGSVEVGKDNQHAGPPKPLMDAGIPPGGLNSLAMITPDIDHQIDQHSGEPSRYSFVEGQNPETAIQSQERPPLTTKSSKYSQASGGRPASPPTPPPPMPAMPQSTPQNFTRGSPGTNEQSNGSPEARTGDSWRPNANRLSQEYRETPIAPQRPLSFEQGGTYITHIRQPSQEGYRPQSQSAHQRGPSFDAQRVRPPSSSSQPYQGPPLSSGVYVPPPRTGPTQPKQFEQPPSSAQRYPELFKSEYAKETSVDGLPANYYQRPISREDAFLPRQQTNEYQLPGVGPPAEQPQPGRHSRRNSGLFKELGGRLSRSASRERGSTREDQPQSPIQATHSRDSHARNVSETSVTSNETIDEKRASSRLGLFGSQRRESTAGAQPPKSHESLITHLSPSRRDSIPTAQQLNSLPPPPDRKKTFFSFGRSSTDDLKSKTNKLSRVSTNSIISEQEGKKKRFSGLTGLFSRQSIDQDKRDPVAPVVAAAQDPRNYQHSSVSAQRPSFSSPGMTQGLQNHPGQPRSSVQGVAAQQPLRHGTAPYSQNSGAFPNGAPGGFIPTNVRLSPQQGQPPVGVQISGSHLGPSPQMNQRQGFPQGQAPVSVSPLGPSPPISQRQGPPSQGQAPVGVSTLGPSPPINQRQGFPPQGEPPVGVQVSGSALGPSPPINQRQGAPSQGETPITMHGRQVSQISPRHTPHASQGQQPSPQHSPGLQNTQEDLRLAALNGRPGPPVVSQEPQPVTRGQDIKGSVPHHPPPSLSVPPQNPPSDRGSSLQQGPPLMEDRASLQPGQPPNFMGAPQQGLSIKDRGGLMQSPPLDSRSSQQQGSPMEHRNNVQQGYPMDNRSSFQQGPPVDNRYSQQQGPPRENRNNLQQGYPMDNRGSFQQGPPVENRTGLRQGSPVNLTGAPRQGPTIDNRSSQQQGLPIADRDCIHPNAPQQQRGGYQGPPIDPGQQLNPNSIHNQQNVTASPGQSNLNSSPSAQRVAESSPEGRSFWGKPSVAQGSQTKQEAKARKNSSTGLFAGLLGGGRRTSAQHVKDDKIATSISPKPASAMKPVLQPQQQKQPQLMHPKPIQPRPIQPQVLQPQVLQPQPIQPQLQQKQQHQQPQQSQQQQRFAPQGPPGPSHERGRTLTQEPQYAPLPIPGAYNLVRGDGNQLAPTPYDPRGLNQAFPQGIHPYVYGYQPNPGQQPYLQGQPYAQGPPPAFQKPNGPSPLVLTGQNSNMDARPSLGPYQQSPRKSSRPLSTEDLVARSPARPQFGQQAPYQLTLPNEGEDDTEEEALPNGRSVSRESHLPPGANQQVYKGIPTERPLPADRPLSATKPLNTLLASPALRHPMSPATYPLPEETVFSPINPSASQLPPPAPPIWPGPNSPAKDLDRSNTVNTQTDRSEISQLSGNLSVPSQPIDQVQGIKDGPTSITPPSPQITPQVSPERSPAQVKSPHVPASQSSEDLYSASPLPSPGQRVMKSTEQAPPVGDSTRAAPADQNHAKPPNSTPSPIKIPGQQAPQHPQQHLSPPLRERAPLEEGKESVVGMGNRRRPSQEEKILVEEGMIRPGSANTAVHGQVHGHENEDDVPSMSATSYPGQEWNPYGGCEEWD